MKSQIILFIDDDEFQLEFVTDMLLDLGVVNVLTAKGGQAGLVLYDELPQKPDLLLCDLSMPDMDGIEFLRHIGERGFEGGIALLSGVDERLLKAAESLICAYSFNLLGTMKKPARNEDLLAMLNQSMQVRPGKSSRTQDVLLTYDEVKNGLGSGQLEVFFQPKVLTAERCMIGVEALARWRHPERGLLGPNTFISVAEQHGLIDELTMEVLRQAVCHLSKWKEQGCDCKVAVNLSAINLNRLDLPEIILKIVQDAGIESKNIVLEITESELMKDYNLSLDILTRLRLKGFNLSVDDYGTGYSNMEKLKQLPFSELKIDRAFVFGAADDPTTRAILESSVHLGKTLGMNLVAEGVETQDEWDLIAKLGCNEVQGYFIARPMPAAELCAWKIEWEKSAVAINSPDRKKTGNEALPLIMEVDDDAMMREILMDELCPSFQVLALESGEACLGSLRDDKPDLILLDVEMPGIGGYETCRRIREDSETAQIPVIFLSGNDRIEDRLKGYENGGDDYVLKPFNAVELTAKIQNLLRLYRERRQQNEMARYASSTAMTAMTSMGEMGALIETMKNFNACNAFPALAAAVFSGLVHYNLSGVIQIRASDAPLTYTENGEASPLESSVINHMASMDRITSFKNRMCITYERASLLINNMPTDDPDRCGRLRDHLAMMVEGVNVRIQAIMLGNALSHTIENLSKTLGEIDAAQRMSKAATCLNLNALNEDITRAYLSLGMTNSQEDFLSQVIQKGIERIVDDESSNLDFQDKLSALVLDLKKIQNT